jgi:MYXO-CTERM domain-containing protein
VVFRAHAGELVRFSGIASDAGAIEIAGRSWLEFDGFTVEDVGSWVRVVDSDHVVIRNGTFARATIEGTRGSIKLLRSEDCTLADNTLDEGNDNIVIVDSDRNRVLDNRVTSGRHSLISLRCSDANVVRGNYFDNPIQKAIEVYDCEGSSSDDPVIFDATKRNLFEGNEFAGTAPSDASYDYNAMQLAGQDGIIRRNVYHDDLGGGVHLQVYSDEALENHGNRIYHNTFFAERCWALAASANPSPGYYDNRVVANLLFANADCQGGGEQISPGDPIAAAFADNTLATEDPGFVDAAAADFHLAPGSAVIDTGPWLAHAVGAGRGTDLTVDDARWFFDGGGVIDELGDLVQLEGDGETARVVGIDLEAGMLVLDAPLSWADGQGLALAYAGEAPEPGAFELGLPDPDPGGSDGGLDESGGSEGGSATGDDAAGTSDGISTSGGSGGSETSGANESESGGGCSCRAGASASGLTWPLLLVVLGGLRRRTT